MDLTQAIVLGIVQGATEFLPVSSTAHMRIVPSLLGWPDPGAAFTAVIQLGTLAAVFVYFRGDLARAFSAWVRSFYDTKARRSPDGRMGWAIFVGTIPIMLAGVIFKDEIRSQSVRSLYVVSWALIAMGLLLAAADRLARHRRKVESTGIGDGLWVGLWQAIALVPGASRSGSTITGALFAGFDRAAAARFSFLLSVPSIFAAAAISLYDERKRILDQQLGATAAAVLAAFVVGYLSIGWLIAVLQKRSAIAFVVYRVALGLAIILLLRYGVLSPTD